MKKIKSASMLLLSFILIISMINTSKGATFYKTVDHSMPNVIYMIGDGMGPEQVKLASIVEYGAPNRTIMDTDFPIKDFFSTDTVDGELTDSAASGTALATGHLTGKGIVGMDKTKSIYYKNILEYLKYDFGYSAGVITTTEFAHATPATFTAHVGSRDYIEDIYNQMLPKNLNVIMGGGLNSYFSSENDAYNLALKYHYKFASTRDDMLSLSETADHLLGVFPYSHMPYELERDPETIPSIVEMTESAIKILDRQDTPFFLMVEGGRIDHAGHMLNTNVNKTLYNAMETIMFEKSVRAALDFAQQDGNTIIIVDADHETGGLKVLDYSNLTDKLPSDDNTRDENNLIRMNRVANISVSWEGSSHTRTKVPFYMYGVDKLNYDINTNADTFHALVSVLGNFPIINYQQYVINDNNTEITVKGSFTDHDMTASQVDIFIEYGTTLDMNSITVRFNNNNDTFDFQYTLSIPDEDYRIFYRVVDEPGNAVFSFDSNNDLIMQDVSYSIPTENSSTVSTLITDGPASNITTTTTSVYFPLLGSVILLFAYIKNKKK